MHLKYEQFINHQYIVTKFLARACDSLLFFSSGSTHGLCLDDLDIQALLKDEESTTDDNKVRKMTLRLASHERF